MRKILFCLSYTLLSIHDISGQLPSFSEISDQSGILDITKIAQPFGYGASLADFDNDGDIDFFLCTDSGIPNRLYSNNGDGTFQDVASTLGLASLNSSNAALWFDYNGDRLLDLVTVGNCLESGCEKSIVVSLYQQTSNGNFMDTTESAGLSLPTKYSATTVNPLITTGGLAAADINNDGHLDLLITIWKGTNSLFVNNGDGTFSDVSSSYAFASTQKDYWQGIFNDFNNDGLIDLYLNIDFAANELWINQGDNSFEEIASISGVDSAFNEMGIALGDYDNDGDFDMYATNITVDDKYNIFLENTTQGNLPSFTEISRALDIAESGWDWGTTFFDANNDGWLDLATTNGYVSFPADKSQLWINNQDKTFTDISNSANFNDNLFATTLVSFDMDRDGDLDLLQTLKENETTNKPLFLYKNLIQENFEPGNYVVIKPRMLGNNHFSIGATVRIKSGELRSIRPITAGTSFYGQEPAEAFFGLNDNTTVDEIVIEWPDNTITVLNDVSANQVITVTNEVISEQVFGCTDPASCTYNPIANIDDGSCQYTSSSDISGPSDSGFNQVEVYTYTNDGNSELNWTVEGGELISGQGTSNITVKWGLNATGRIILIERSESCANTTKTLEVALDINNRETNISIARIWNEALLEAIRNDFARPTVHARNLFHSAIAIYDAWAVHNGTHTYLLGKETNGFESNLERFIPLESLDQSLEKSISYAMYRLLVHRFKNSPEAQESLERFDFIMDQLNYDTAVLSVDYSSGDAAALGNYIAQTIIEYGLNDNSREATDYDNAFYTPINPSLDLNSSDSGYTGIIDPNHWQPLKFSTFIDQSGNLISESIPTFLSPEWGSVLPFALSETDKEVFNRSGNDYSVYHNPEAPPELTSENPSSVNNYKWNFSLVSQWGSHLDPNDGVLWDIAPGSIGNTDINEYPENYVDYTSFYNVSEGGDIGKGRSINPKTGQPYEPQIVPRGDYARVLAEFWADGPDSETPPGHWFTILNYVTDHNLFSRRFNGEGNELSPLEWDVKAYFILGGAMHDAAVAAWGIKGWHDYIRPISAIRYMCELGQSSDNSLSNYHPQGIQLKPGYVEVVASGDPLSGALNENVGKIKLYSWRGHDFINDSATDVAGVGWILAENWWPYQRPSFVTPPFAGFVSGHSTFSRAAAEVLTLITGDAYFPGGLGEFVAKKDEFLVFEKGPSVDVKLQWATYRDASDQTSLSRIWGGIHPPVDDIPGRLIGEKIGVDAYNFAIPFFEPAQNSFLNNLSEPDEIIMYPNPIDGTIFFNQIEESTNIAIFSISGQLISNGIVDSALLKYDVPNLPSGLYFVQVSSSDSEVTKIMIKK
ncbi:FG-GAP-like repeat-containing protein [uncultured Croceitalea sp.]|uniref:FG-GAP-like repeat-containing protein n=1 Tax=uncultured Croceitalea sp. TaxID=1798908 RepID=UPI003306194D